MIGVAGIVFAWAAGRSRLRLEIAGLATCALVAGLLLLLQARTSTTANASISPELSAVDQATITRGKAIYDMNCATCHGAACKGDGPSAAGLNPPTADSTNPIHTHDPEDLVLWVKNDIPGSAMPAFGDTLTEEKIQDVLAYVAALRRRVGVQREVCTSSMIDSCQKSEICRERIGSTPRFPNSNAKLIVMVETIGGSPGGKE